MTEPVGELQILRAQMRLLREIDDLLELAIRTHAPLEQTAPRMLSELAKACSASSVILRTRDEDGDHRDYVYPDLSGFEGFDVNKASAEVEDGNEVHYLEGAHSVVGHRLDVADECVGVVLVASLPDRNVSLTAGLAEIWAETVDNYLGSMNDTRRKQRALARVSDALKSPILEDSLDQALLVLREYIPWDDLVLVFMSEDYLDKRSLTYRVFTDGEWAYSSLIQLDERIDSLMRGAAKSILDYETEETTLKMLGVKATHIEDVAILGRTSASVIGRLIIGTNSEPLTPFGRDVLDRFADYLRQRAVDFSKEWKRLSRNFPQEYVRRLLSSEDYVPMYLAPRRQHVAVLYTDIAGFTHLSEQVLKEPESIGNLIDRWSRHVVEIIWETGGVFDKMVGDCIIGLWGPPFFDISGQQACRSAAEAARRIGEYTRLLGQGDEFAEMRASGRALSVATGINYCPMFVGFFGPSEDYTGFSSGMNNAARLQGVAVADQILCMEGFVQAHGDDSAFGACAEAMVKNVQEPLRFRSLKT